MLVSDLRHFLDLPAGTPTPAVRLAEYLGTVVRAATAGPEGASWVSALTCRRRPGNRRCPGRVGVRRADARAPIAWECTACGDQGLVSDWQDTPYDLRGGHVGSAGVALDTSVSDEVAASLREVLLLDPEVERVVYGARAEAGRVVLTATDELLEELAGSLAAEANHETDRRRRRRFEAAFDELSSAARRASEPVAASARKRGTGGGAPVAAPGPTSAGAGLPELDVARVQRWCVARVPERARHQVRVECEVADRHLTIVERRAPWRTEAGPDWTALPVARLRYAKTAGTWTLYARGRNLRFHRYDRLRPSCHVDDLLIEIDRDSTGIFWG